MLLKKKVWGRPGNEGGGWGGGRERRLLGGKKKGQSFKKNVYILCIICICYHCLLVPYLSGQKLQSDEG